MKTYLACMGTRPEIIKMAAIHRILKERGERVIVLHTGQHENIAQVLYKLFEMGPDLQINLQRRSTRLGDLTASLLEGVDRIVEEVKPDVVLVQGDTTSALAGALAGYYHDIPVAHVEAGLRTGQRDPFPEEKNREMIARLANWHFPPTVQARRNLICEGIDEKKIFVVGNTVIDAALWIRERMSSGAFDSIESMPIPLQKFLLGHPMQRLVLVTAHRRENWGQPIRDIAKAVGILLENHLDLTAVWPVHPNPAVRKDVEAVINMLSVSAKSRICLTESLDYPALIAVLDRCYFTLTDSGGIQEEASAMARPVLIARSSTERQELIQVGGARLVGTDVNCIVEEASKLLTHSATYQAMQLSESPFGDGHSAKKIVDVLMKNH